MQNSNQVQQKKIVKSSKDLFPYTRFFIIKEGLFKNKKKIMSIYKDTIVFNNLEESEKEEIHYEDIINVVSLENSHDFTIIYKDPQQEVLNKTNSDKLNKNKSNLNNNSIKYSPLRDSSNNNNENNLKEKSSSMEKKHLSVTYTANANIINQIICEILKQIDTINKNKENLNMISNKSNINTNNTTYTTNVSNNNNTNNSLLTNSTNISPKNNNNNNIFSNKNNTSNRNNTVVSEKNILKCFLFLNENCKQYFSVNKETDELLLNNNKLKTASQNQVNFIIEAVVSVYRTFFEWSSTDTSGKNRDLTLFIKFCDIVRIGVLSDYCFKVETSNNTDIYFSVIRKEHLIEIIKMILINTRKHIHQSIEVYEFPDANLTNKILLSINSNNNTNSHNNSSNNIIGISNTTITNINNVIDIEKVNNDLVINKLKNEEISIKNPINNSNLSHYNNINNDLNNINNQPLSNHSKKKFSVLDIRKDSHVTINNRIPNQSSSSQMLSKQLGTVSIYPLGINTPSQKTILNNISFNSFNYQFEVNRVLYYQYKQPIILTADDENLYEIYLEETQQSKISSMAKSTKTVTTLNNINNLNSANNSNLNNYQLYYSYSSLLSENDINSCIKIVKIPIQKIMYIIPLSTSTNQDFFEIVLDCNTRYIYQSQKKQRNEIVASIVSLYEQIQIKNENIKPILMLNSKPKLEMHILGFSNSLENDIEYEKNIIKKLVTAFSTETSEENKEKKLVSLSNATQRMNKEYKEINSQFIINNVSSKSYSKEMVLEEVCLNFCFSSFHFKQEYSFSNKMLFNNLYDSLAEELQKYEKLVNQNSNNNCGSKNRSPYKANKKDLTINTTTTNNNNINNNVIGKKEISTSPKNTTTQFNNFNTNNNNTNNNNNNSNTNNQNINSVNATSTKERPITPTSDNNQNNNNSNNPSPIISQKQEEEFETKKSKQIYLINLYLIISKHLLIKFNYEKLLSEILNFISEHEIQSIFFNTMSIFKELLPCFSKSSNEYQQQDIKFINNNDYESNLMDASNFKKEEIAQKKWIISAHFENGLLLKSFLIKFLLNYKNDMSLKHNWEEVSIIPVYSTLELIKHFHLFTVLITNGMKLSHFKDFSNFNFLYILTITLKSSSNLLKQSALSLLLALLDNLSYEQEFKFKQTILNETLIFFIILHMFLNPSHEHIKKLCLKFLKNFLISHVEATNLLTNIFPKPMFYLTSLMQKSKVPQQKNNLKISKNNPDFHNNSQNMTSVLGFNARGKEYGATNQMHIHKPNPINWLDHEWNTFFNNLHKNTVNIRFIWNEETKNELSDYLLEVINKYIVFSDSGRIIKSMFLRESEYPTVKPFNNNTNTTGTIYDANNSVGLHLTYSQNKNQITNSELSNNMTSNFIMNNNNIPLVNNKDNNQILSLLNFQDINCSFYCMNYKELRKADNYYTLDKYHFVYKYYLKLLIQEEQSVPGFAEQIDEPIKFWERLLEELLITNPQKIEKTLLIVKAMCLLYRDHSEIIGSFKYYSHLATLFTLKNEKNEINEYIIQLILVSLDTKERELRKQNIELFFDSEFFIEDLLFNFIDHLLYSNKNFLYKNCIADLNEKEFFEEYVAKFRWNERFFKHAIGGSNAFINLPCVINSQGDIINENNMESKRNSISLNNNANTNTNTNINKVNSNNTNNSNPNANSNTNTNNILGNNVNSNLNNNNINNSNNATSKETFYTIHDSDFNLMNFLDNKPLIIKNLGSDFLFDKFFCNFTKYQYVHFSFNKGDKSIKCLTFIVRIFKILLKKFKIISEGLFKIYYPIPRIKLVFLKKENFFKIILLLLINNNNLALETLDLLLNYLNDSITYKEVVHYTNLQHILVYYLLKYRSKSIMRYLENMNFFNGIFNNNEITGISNANINNSSNINNNNNNNINNNANKKHVNATKENKELEHNSNKEVSSWNLISLYTKLNIDEQKFLKAYPECNKLLIRYFPINVIYHYMKSDFEEFIKVLFSLNQYEINQLNNISLNNQIYSETYLIWNRNMLKNLVDTLVSDMRRFLAGEFAKNLRPLTYESNESINYCKFSNFTSSIYKFDLDFKQKYEIENKQKCLIYYIKEFENIGIKDGDRYGENTNYLLSVIEDTHIDLCVDLLTSKVKELINKSNDYLTNERIIIEMNSYFYFYKLLVLKNYYVIKDSGVLLENITESIIKTKSYADSDGNIKKLVGYISDIIIFSFNNIEMFSDENACYNIRLIKALVNIINWYAFSFSFSNNEDTNDIEIKINEGSNEDKDKDNKDTKDTKDNKENKEIKDNNTINTISISNSDNQNVLLRNKSKGELSDNNNINALPKSISFTSITNNNNNSNSNNLNDIINQLTTILKTLNSIINQSHSRTSLTENLILALTDDLCLSFHRIFYLLIFSKNKLKRFNFTREEIELVFEMFNILKGMSNQNELLVKLVTSGLYLELIMLCYLYKTNKGMYNRMLSSFKNNSNVNNEEDSNREVTASFNNKNENMYFNTTANNNNNIVVPNLNFKNEDYNKDESYHTIKNYTNYNNNDINNNDTNDLYATKSVNIPIQNIDSEMDHKLKVNNFLAINSIKILSLLKSYCYLITSKNDNLTDDSNKANVETKVKLSSGSITNFNNKVTETNNSYVSEKDLILAFNKFIDIAFPSTFGDLLNSLFEKNYIKENYNTSNAQENFIERNTSEELFTLEKQFLEQLKSEIKLPDFIWDKKLRKEFKCFLEELMNEFCFKHITEETDNRLPEKKDEAKKEKQPQKQTLFLLTSNFISKLNNFKFLSYSGELKIENIYIKIYNNYLNYKITDSNSFLTSLMTSIFSYEAHQINQEILESLLLALNNCLLANPNVNEKIILDDNKFLNKYSILLRKSETFPSSLQLLCTFSIKSEYSVKFIFDNLDIFSFINKIIDEINNLEYLRPVLKFLTHICKKEYFKKINLSVFLFLLKRLLLSKPNNEEIREFDYDIEDNYYAPSVNRLDSNYKIVSSIMPNIGNNNNKTDINNISTNNNRKKLTSHLKNSDYTLPKLSSSPFNNFNSSKELPIRVEILKTIKTYLKNDFFFSTLNYMIEMYLPSKIVEMIFSHKEITNDTLDWIDNVYEYPDLIWNEASFKKSISLIDEDCTYVLREDTNINDFPQNLFNYKLNNKSFFFEISQEYIIDNIYVRVFNKYPSYNLSKPLILFFKHVCSSFLNTFDNYLISMYLLKQNNFGKFKNSKITKKIPDNNNNNNNTSENTGNQLNQENSDNLNTDKIETDNENENINSNEKRNKMTFSYQELVELESLSEKLYSKALIGLASIMLIIEQIFQNDFNENLLVSSHENLTEINKNLVKDENEKLIITLVQRSIENKKILNSKTISNLIDFISSCFFQIGPEYLDISFRVLLLEIIYLFTLQKDQVQYLDSLDYTKLVDRELSMEYISDVELVLLISTLFRLISYESSYLPKVSTELFDKLNVICCSRSYVLKHFQKLVAKILLDSQYGESLAQIIKKKQDKYSSLVSVVSNKQVFLECSNIWRKGPESKEQAEIIYKTNQNYNVIDKEKLESINEISNFESKFPYIPDTAITVVNFDELKKEKVDMLGDYVSTNEELKKQSMLLDTFKTGMC